MIGSDVKGQNSAIAYVPPSLSLILPHDGKTPQLGLIRYSGGQTFWQLNSAHSFRIRIPRTAATQPQH